MYQPWSVQPKQVLLVFSSEVKLEVVEILTQRATH